jgi:hypothetical protein
LRTSRRLAAALLQLSVPAAVVAQGSAGPARLTPVILGFPSSVQAAGLAGAGVALPGYAGALFVNPAGLAPIRVLSLEAGFSRRPDHSTYAMVAAATRVGRFNLGFGGRYLRFSADSSIYDNLSWVGAVVYRHGGIAFGASTKYISVEQRAGPTSRALTGDLAVQIAFFDIAALALSAQNLAQSRLSGETLALPEALHVGFSLNLLDTYSNGRLLATVESVWSAGERGRTMFGLEAGLAVSGIGVLGRIGSGRQPGLVGGLLSHTTFGGSVLLGRARLDYAFQHRSTLGRNVHLFGARWTP